MADPVRQSAYRAAKRIFEGAFSNLVFNGTDLCGTHLAFAKNITMGTVERRYSLEYALSLCTERNVDRDLSVLLCTGLYQILYMSKVPDSAAVNETVSLASELFGKKVTGFANAVLRKAANNKDDLKTHIENSDPWIKFSVNKELFELLKEQYPSECDSIFEAFFSERKHFLRVNTILSDSESVALETGGVAIDKKTVCCTDAKKAVEGVKSGHYFFQGLASQKAVSLLDAKQGVRVIDVCACPGGKSLGAAIDMNNCGELFSFDLHKNKLSLIQRSAAALGLDIIKTDVCDGRTGMSELFGTAQRVICDVPCSGTGEMGAKPEIKYKSPHSFLGLYPTQRAILSTASKYLVPGGKLVYSTCSVNKTENLEAVEAFLRSEEGAEFSLGHFETFLPTGETGEGFFCAELYRKSK